MRTIKLMLVDDHDVIRTGLKTFLDTQSEFSVVAEAGSGSEAIAKAGEVHPDVIIMDITMPGMDGLQATRSLKEMLPETHVLVLTVHEDKQYLFEMMAAGASGYLTKQAASDELVAAIHAVAVGSVYLQPTLARWLLEDYRRLHEECAAQTPTIEYIEDPGKDLEVLSKRELQVLELVAEGMTNQQTGKRLGISPKTVARHRERIMNKLDLHSSTELVKFAIRTGLIDLD